MKNSPLRFTFSDSGIDVKILASQAEGWLLAGDINQHSPATLQFRKDLIHKLLWFFERENISMCGTNELRKFLAYLTHGHENPGGRWGNPQMTRKVRPGTVHTYHGHLRTFFRWLIVEGVVTDSPMERIPAPCARPDQVQPFTVDQIQSLLSAAKRSRHPKRDEAIIFFLYDTGLRATELCSIKLKDIDISGRRVELLGKGNKRRMVYFGKQTARVLWGYLKEDDRSPEDPLFTSERGDSLTRSGLLQLVERLGKDAAIEVTRCSPHTFRHTFAINFLRSGGNVFSLQQLLGHSSLHMTNRYVALAQADMENQHRQFSPVDRMIR